MRKLTVERLVQRLSEIYDTLGEELVNPLIRTIIELMWFERPVVEITSGIKTLQLQ